MIHRGPTAAPPPTPCAQPNTIATSTSSDAAAADALTRLLLHRLPSNLSLPTSRLRSSSSSSAAASVTSLPAVSLSDDQTDGDLLSAATKLGFFQLVDHEISAKLAESAESDSLSLFRLTKEEKETLFHKNWPLGYDGDEEDETASFCLNAESSSELKLSSSSEFTRALETVGLKVVEKLAGLIGFENPFKNDPTRFCSLMWVYEGLRGEKPVGSGGFYPYVVGLQYVIRNCKYSLLADSGWASVEPRLDSVLVTIGDIAQVWSNGKLKKVRGRTMPCMGDGDRDDSRCIAMSLLLTLPMDATVSPLIPAAESNDIDEEEKHGSNIEDGGGEGVKQERRVFRSFSFEDYAWRVYHEPLLFKDPLDWHRIKY